MRPAILREARVELLDAWWRVSIDNVGREDVLARLLKLGALLVGGRRERTARETVFRWINLACHDVCLDVDAVAERCGLERQLSTIHPRHLAKLIEQISAGAAELGGHRREKFRELVRIG